MQAPFASSKGKNVREEKFACLSTRPLYEHRKFSLACFHRRIPSKAAGRFNRRGTVSRFRLTLCSCAKIAIRENEPGEPPTRRDMFSVLRRSPLSKRGAARPKNLDRIVRHILNQSQESQRHNVERLKGLREIMARNWIYTRSMDRNGPYVDTADDVNIDTAVIASDEVATQPLAGNRARCNREADDVHCGRR